MSDQRLEKRIETTEGQVPVIRMIASRPPPMDSFIARSSSPSPSSSLAREGFEEALGS